MTAQAQDPFFFRGESYFLSNVMEAPLFDPRAHGFLPFATCSACWAGYLASFALDTDRLLLRTLHINHGMPKESGPPDPLTPPPLAGRAPVPANPEVAGDYGFQWSYEDVNLPLDFTGPVLIGRGDLMTDRFHGRPWPWQQEEVRLLRFEHGVLTHDEDLAPRMATYRQRYCYPEEGGLYQDADQRRNAQRFMRRWTGLKGL